MKPDAACELALCMLAIVQVAYGISVVDWLWYPVQDGVIRVRDIKTIAEFSQGMQNHEVMVTLFYDGASTHETTNRMNLVHQNMIELTAQLLEEEKDISFFSLDMSKSHDVTDQEGVKNPGTIHVYRDGQKHVYNGYKNLHHMHSYIKKVRSPIVHVIDSRLSRKKFEDIDDVNVLGVFTEITTVPEIFHLLAKQYHPEISFFVIHNVTISEQLDFDQTQGDKIHLFRPSDKFHMTVPSTASSEELSQMLRDHRQPVFDHMTLANVHDILDYPDSEVRTILAFCRRQSQADRVYYKALKTISRKYADQPRLHVVVIDMDVVPMVPSYWQKTFNIDMEKHAIGLVNMSDTTSMWFDQTSYFGEEVTDANVRQALGDWFQNIINKQIRVDGLPPETMPSEDIPRAELPGVADDTQPDEAVQPLTAEDAKDEL